MQLSLDFSAQTLQDMVFAAGAVGFGIGSCLGLGIIGTVGYSDYAKVFGTPAPHHPNYIIFCRSQNLAKSP